MNQEFWEYLLQLVATNQIEFDHPKGSTHYRFPTDIYPVN
jgi:hypothetical protein